MNSRVVALAASSATSTDAASRCMSTCASNSLNWDSTVVSKPERSASDAGRTPSVGSHADSTAALYSPHVLLASSANGSSSPKVSA